MWLSEISVHTTIPARVFNYKGVTDDFCGLLQIEPTDPNGP